LYTEVYHIKYIVITFVLQTYNHSYKKNYPFRSIARGYRVVLYVSTTHTAVSGAILQEREVCKEGRKLSQQVSIYFISEALADSKKYYSKIEKICYAIVMSARKLHHYFKAHRVRVLTNQPLNTIFKNRDCSGRIRKWAMELPEHVIGFKKRSTIKSQVLANFVANWMEPSSYTEGPVIDTPW
jgi:hypothetical protein